MAARQLVLGLALMLPQCAVLATEAREQALLQTWSTTLEGQSTGAEDTPITRVVNLLKEMQETLKKEQEEDEAMYEKAACWCNNMEYEKKEAIAAAEKNIDQLESTIEKLTAKSAELNTLIKETEEELAKDTNELKEATALRQKQLKSFHGEELDAIQGVENLKAAIIVLGKHASFPQLSLLGLKSRHRLVSAHGARRDPLAVRELDSFMHESGMDTDAAGVRNADRAVRRFLQEKGGDEGDQVSQVQTHSIEYHASAVTEHEKMIVKKALNTANAFLQAQGDTAYMYTPGYESQSGEILGILKQMKEEMQADLSEAQKEEAQQVADFEELRSAKTDEIAAAEKLLEEKKQELAQADFDLANAKEDLEEVQATLAEDQKFLGELLKNCAILDKNFELRKKSRIDEIQAVSETIEILTSDEARDAANGAYAGFLQIESRRARRSNSRRAQAAKALRSWMIPELSVLASQVELDAFTKVKKMMDDMVATLKTQQSDEVKKNDWCKAQFQENEMETMKADDLSKDQTVKIEDLGQAIKALGEEIAAAGKSIKDMQVELQRASMNRQKENYDFQKTISDQVATQEILAKALDKLATFYDKEFFVQVGRRSHRVSAGEHHAKQMPPMPEAEYKPSSGSGGVMSMIEKLIYEAKELEAEAKEAEAEAQVAYETLVSDTNVAVGELQTAVVTKTEEIAKSENEKTETEEALQGTMADLEDLAKYKSGLHKDCDYLLKNFAVRQESRAAEIEAIQQAKQILSGAK